MKKRLSVEQIVAVLKQAELGLPVAGPIQEIGMLEAASMPDHGAPRYGVGPVTRCAGCKRITCCGALCSVAEDAPDLAMACAQAALQPFKIHRMRRRWFWGGQDGRSRLISPARAISAVEQKAMKQTSACAIAEV
jgi:hypothetical protein